MKIHTDIGFAVLLSTIACASCAEPGNQVLDIDTTGTLSGMVFLDRDGDLTPTNIVDSPIPSLQVTIRTRSGLHVATARTDSTGRFRADDLPTGTYRVVPDPGVLGDSVRVLADHEEATVAARDTARMIIAVGYPTAKIRDLRDRAPGSRVAVNAIALNSWATFGDSTVHFADSTGVIRGFRVRDVVIQAGDTVRLLATTERRDGHAVLDDVALVRTKRGTLPAPVDLNTALAAAGGTALDGEQVRIRNAVVTDGSSLVGGDLLLTINDGSGPLKVLIDADARINTNLPITIGAELDVVGLLVPTGIGLQLMLKPRGTADVAVRYRPISVAEARTRQAGQFAVIQGVALNDLGIFGDLGLHVADNTGAIRIRAAQAGFVATGDSVSVLGQINRIDGQPALVNATASVIIRTNLPSPQPITTLAAAGARNGSADAALVRVDNAIVTDTLTIGGDIHLFVNDGSGVVEVILDRDAISSPPHIVPGSRWAITGLLAPSTRTGVWWLKPRVNADLAPR